MIKLLILFLLLGLLLIIYWYIDIILIGENTEPKIIAPEPIKKNYDTETDSDMSNKSKTIKERYYKKLDKDFETESINKSDELTFGCYDDKSKFSQDTLNSQKSQISEASQKSQISEASQKSQISETSQKSQISEASQSNQSKDNFDDFSLSDSKIG